MQGIVETVIRMFDKFFDVKGEDKPYPQILISEMGELLPILPDLARMGTVVPPVLKNLTDKIKPFQALLGGK
jgi:hypothetical protein